MTPVTFRVGHPAARITPHAPQWGMALPQTRASGTARPAGPAVTYGEYFLAAQRFFLGDGLALAARAVTLLGGQTVSPSAISGLDIHLVKHGAFYHPAKVTVKVGKRRTALVLNVAVSAAGRRALASEYTALERLGRRGRPYLPRVFGHGKVDALAMFVGEWMNGFYEFHPERHNDGALEWRIWQERGRRPLSPAAVDALYTEATRILTGYFNPLTGEAITAWHHAAGDFIVRPTTAGAAVRLITVRRYAPLMTTPVAHTGDPKTLLDTLALFFLDTALRMRLDRIEGVADMVWLPDRIVAAVCRGFVAGAADLAAAGDLPDELGPITLRYLAAHAPSELAALGRQVADRFPANSAERRLVDRHLTTHLSALAAVFRQA